jgi:hypothetical protein
MSKEAQTKGEQIAGLLAKHPEWTRAKVAETVGCTVQRVGEVVRSLGGSAPRKAAAKKSAAVSTRLDRQSKSKSAPAHADEVATKRNDKANYDAIMAGESGDFDAAVAYAKRTKKRTPKRG